MNHIVKILLILFFSSNAFATANDDYQSDVEELQKVRAAHLKEIYGAFEKVGIDPDQVNKVMFKDSMSLKSVINELDSSLMKPEDDKLSYKDKKSQLALIRKVASLQRKYLESTDESESSFVAMTKKAIEPISRKAVKVIIDKDVMASIWELKDHPSLRLTTIVNLVFSLVFSILAFLKRRSIQGFLRKLFFTFSTFGIYTVATSVIIPVVIMGTSYRNFLFALVSAFQNT